MAWSSIRDVLGMITAALRAKIASTTRISISEKPALESLALIGGDVGIGALAAFLAATRRELRREVNVLEVSPGHMETGFADRALAGEPPAMPEGEDVDELVGLIVEAIEQGRREIRYDPKARESSVK